MDEKILKELFKILLDRKVDFAGYSPSGVYFAPDSGRRAFFENYNKDVPEEEKAKLYDFDYETLDKVDFPVFNKILVVGADEETTKLLRSRPDLETAASTGNFLDVMKVGSTKGNGLMMLADRLGIPRENTFAIGDNENDLPMLQMAAHSIAMGNSREDIKACCDYVTSNCDEDGFAKAMREYVLPMVREDQMLP
jgi:Cof subfamily protein (haloacid dehalogenase superfamily)